MSSNQSNSNRIKQLLHDGEAQDIYDAIKTCAERCFEKLENARNENEIETSDENYIKQRVNYNLDKADDIRNALSIADKRIDQEKSKSHFNKTYQLYLEYNHLSETRSALIEYLQKNMYPFTYSNSR